MNIHQLEKQIIQIAPEGKPARDYQIEAIWNIYKAWSRGDNHVLLQAPTGTGKTFIFSILSQLINNKGNKVLVLTHRHKLLKQAGASFRSFGLNPYFIQAGIKYANNKPNFFIGMTKTLENRMDKPEWIEWIKDKVIIVDECHLQHFNWLFESGIIDNNYVAGFSATPKRSGKQRQLGLDYHTIIDTISVRKAIDIDCLVNCDMYDVGGVSTSNIKYDAKKGDFQEKSMFSAFNNSKMYSGLLKNYESICPDTKTIVFCCNIEHTIRTALELEKAGYSCKYVVSKVNMPRLPKDLDNEAKMAEYYERKKVYDMYIDTYNRLSGNQDDVLEEFERGEFQFLLNKDILTAGYDCPDIETVIIYRLTQSISLWLQMLGRGSRIAPWINKTHFTVLYFGDNRKDLGEYDEDRIWSLWHEESKGEGLPPTKLCGIDSKGRPISGAEKEGCKRMIHASLNICPKCGFKYPEKAILEAELEGVALDIESGQFVAHKRVKDMSLKELAEHRRIKKHKMPWLWRQLYFRGGEDLINEFGTDDKYAELRTEGKKWTKGTIEMAINICKRGNK